MRTNVQKKSSKYSSIGVYRMQVDYLRRQIKRLGLYQCDVAKYFGWDPSNFSKVLNGRSVPNAAEFAYWLFHFSPIFSDDSYRALMNLIKRCRATSVGASLRFKIQSYVEKELGL